MRRRAALAAMIATLPLAAACGSAEGDTPGGPIIIGSFGPLTGPTAHPGTAQLRGAELRVKELNEQGGVLGREIKLVSCDDKSSPEQGTACVNRLIDRENAVAIAGTLHSPIVAATAPIVDRRQIPMVAGGTAVDWCQAGSEYVWRSTANTDVYAHALSDAVASSDIESIAVLYQNDDYGISGAESLAGIEGITVVGKESYNASDRDFSAQIIKLVRSGPDAIGVWGLTDNLGTITNQLRQQGWDGPIIGPEAYADPTVADVAGDNMNGVIFSIPYYVPEEPSDFPDPDVQAVLESYIDEYGEMPNSDNVYRGYDAISIIAEAIESAESTDGPEIRDAINAMSGFDGLAGTFNFAEGGCDGITESRVWTWDQGRTVPFDESAF